MIPFLYLGGNIEDCTKKLSWPTLSVMKQTPPTIPYFPLILIWDPTSYSSLMALNLLLRLESPLLSMNILLRLPMFGKCSLMELLLRKVLVLD
jgi:hypothetical protein